MKKHIQTLLAGKASNCFQTALACMLNVDPILIPNFGLMEEYFNDNEMKLIIDKFLKRAFKKKLIKCSLLKKYHLNKINKFPKLFKNQYYFITGKFNFGNNPEIHHIVICKNGKMIWDPFPDQPGVIIDKTIECYFLKNI